MRNPPNPYTLLAKYIGRGMDPITADRKVKQQIAASMQPTLLHEYKGVCCDQLAELFTEFTKLFTRLR